jgi:hypothetical protein
LYKVRTDDQEHSVVNKKAGLQPGRVSRIDASVQSSRYAAINIKAAPCDRRNGRA